MVEQTAHRDAGSWLATTTRSHPERGRVDQRLAHALDRRYTQVADALTDGLLNVQQAEVITRALDDLPADVPDDVVELAEKALVGHGGDFNPTQLTRIGRHILDVVAPEVADEAEAKRLADLERHARAKTRFSMRRCGDGTTRFSGRLPDNAASRLATYLEAFTNPRKHADGVVASDSPGDPVARLAYPRKLGEAFVQLARVPSTRAPAPARRRRDDDRGHHRHRQAARVAGLGRAADPERGRRRRSR